MDITTFEANVDDLKDRARPRIEKAKEQLVQLNGKITSVIQEHPTACLLGALALGYVVARVARRQSWWL